MSDSEEKKQKDSSDSQTINIEIPAESFKGMFRMMTGRGHADRAGSRCCESSRGRCRPSPGENDDQEIKIVIKRKEN
jgi:hypothetical protein